MSEDQIDLSTKAQYLNLLEKILSELHPQQCWSNSKSFDIPENQELQSCLYPENGIEIGVWKKKWTVPDNLTQCSDLVRISVGYNMHPSEKLVKIQKLAILLSQHGASLSVNTDRLYIVIGKDSFISAMVKLKLTNTV